MTETENGATTIYEYDLERIAAYTTDNTESVTKTQYIHDAGGSVIQTLSSQLTEELKASAAAPVAVSYSYTPFGQQLGTAVSGYTYNAEYYNSATGMINLRAKQYEPLTMRFRQQDAIRGTASDPISINRYLYCHNNPLSFSDPTGMSIFSKLKSAAKSAAKAVKSAAKAATAKVVSTGVKSAIAYCKQNPMEILHGALDVIGMIPAFGNIADALKAAVYLSEGDYVNAALSAVALIPMAGAVAKLGKIASKSDTHKKPEWHAAVHLS